MEQCLAQLPAMAKDQAEFEPCSFFSDQARTAASVDNSRAQLTGFEVWLEMGSSDIAEKRAPEQLPIVLQVLLSQQHRRVLARRTRDR